MNGEGFAYFRWCSSMGLLKKPTYEPAVRSIWRDLQQRAFHRRMAKPKDKLA